MKLESHHLLNCRMSPTSEVLQISGTKTHVLHHQVSAFFSIGLEWYLIILKRLGFSTSKHIPMNPFFVPEILVGGVLPI